ncbi:hypothetical protein IQ250_04555 [Pseudanabaenaceae cyanobacterium LEGE 13415]|nr:hypothetical protein [Pseudanabaenaceae cyanobacterium LEGE 13415]
MHEPLSERLEIRLTKSQKQKIQRTQNASQRLRDAIDLITGDTPEVPGAVSAPEIPDDLIDDGLLPIGEQPQPQRKRPKSKGTVIGSTEKRPNAMINADRRTPDDVVI